MSWFKNIFGSSKGDAPNGGGSARSKSSSPPPPAAHAQQAALDKIADLKGQIDTLQKKIDFTELKIKEEEEKLKALLRECGTDAVKKERKKPQITRHMQAIHRFKTVIEQESAKQQNLQTLSDKMEETLGNVQQQSAVAEVAKVMKGLAMNVDEVQNVNDDLHDIIEDQEQITGVLTQSLAPEFEVDEDDLEGYLNEALGESAAQEASLPQLQPALELPSAGKKHVPVSAAQKESEDELDRIAASMA